MGPFNSDGQTFVLRREYDFGRKDTLGMRIILPIAAVVFGSVGILWAVNGLSGGNPSEAAAGFVGVVVAGLVLFALLTVNEGNAGRAVIVSGAGITVLYGRKSRLDLLWNDPEFNISLGELTEAAVKARPVAMRELPRHRLATKRRYRRAGAGFMRSFGTYISEDAFEGILSAARSRGLKCVETTIGGGAPSNEVREIRITTGLPNSPTRAPPP
jgi:hypothetical protein